MEKRITINYSDPRNTFSVINKDGLSKIAGETTEEVSKFIRNLDIDTNRYVYVLINAMGAEEIYGDNNNHDSFPEYYEGKPNLINDGPDYGYKTFQTNAHLFKHHRNKDPKNKYGDVLLAVYNHKMHRPELVVRIDRMLAPEEAEKVDNGEVLATSMGAKVPYDVCSICGHKSKTRSEYCNHLKKQMGKILPDGRKVFAINPRPKFFDISMVFIPADSTSRVMKKLAHIKANNSLTEKEASIKNAAYKIAEMEKYIKGHVAKKGMDNIVESLIERKMNQLERREVGINRGLLDSMALRFKLPVLLSSMAYSGIIPKPREFQRIVLVQMGKGKFADMLDGNNIVFDRHTANMENPMCDMARVSHNHLNPNIAMMMHNVIPYRSCFHPFMMQRLTMPGMLFNPEKNPCQMNLNPIMSTIAGMYNRYMQTAPESLYGSLKRLMFDSGMVPSIKKRIVIRVNVPMGMDHDEGLGGYMSNSILNLFGSNNVDSGPLDGLKYFIRKVLPSDNNLGNGDMALSSRFRDSIMGTPLLRFVMSSGPNLLKTASRIDDSEGRRWLVDTLSGHKKRGFLKIASLSGYKSKDLYDIVTLAELGKLS